MWTIGLQDRELTCWEEVRGSGPGGSLAPGGATTAEPMTAVVGDNASFLEHDGGDCCWGPGRSVHPLLGRPCCEGFTPAVHPGPIHVGALSCCADVDCDPSSGERRPTSAARARRGAERPPHHTGGPERRDPALLLQLSRGRVPGQDVRLLGPEWGQDNQQPLPVRVQGPDVSALGTGAPSALRTRAQRLPLRARMQLASLAQAPNAVWVALLRVPA